MRHLLNTLTCQLKIFTHTTPTSSAQLWYQKGIDLGIDGGDRSNFRKFESFLYGGKLSSQFLQQPSQSQFNMGKKDVSPEIKLYIAPSDSYDNTPQGFSFRYLPIPQEAGGIDGTSPDAKFKLQISLYGKEAANFDTSLEVAWEPTNKGSAAKFAFDPLKTAQIAGGFIQFTTNKFGKYCCAAN